MVQYLDLTGYLKFQLPVFPKKIILTLDKQYIAVAGDIEHDRYFAMGRQIHGKGTIQIWEFRVEAARDLNQLAVPPVCKYVICHSHGVCMDVKWCPSGNQTPDRLGLLAACFSDGVIAFYSVPKPQETLKYVQLTPIAYSRHADEYYNKIAWNKTFPTLVASSCADGTIVVWNLAEALEGDEFYPVTSIPVHDFNALNLSWSTKEPYFIASGGGDGRFCVTDMREDYPIYISKQSEPQYAASWNERKDAVILPGVDNYVRTILDDNFNKSMQVSLHENAVSAIACSSHHDFIATSSHDGTVKLALLILARMRDKHPFVTTMYRHSFLPEGSVFYEENIKKETMKGRTSEVVFNTVASFIQCVAWNPNPQSCTWLASGSRSGLVRVECAKKKAFKFFSDMDMY